MTELLFLGRYAYIATRDFPYIMACFRGQINKTIIENGQLAAYEMAINDTNGQEGQEIG